jgi:hypothetical protein
MHPMTSTRCPRGDLRSPQCGTATKCASPQKLTDAHYLVRASLRGDKNAGAPPIERRPSIRNSVTRIKIKETCARAT